MTLVIKEFSCLPLTREDANRIIVSNPCPDRVDFSDIVSVSHCFADELFSRLLPHRPEIVNASPFVSRIVSATAAAAR